MTYPNAYNIVSFDKLDYCASLNNTRALNDKRNFSFYHGDITNPSEVMDCLERYKIDTIFHFAAQSHVDLSFGNSYTFTYNNVFGTHVLLESAKKVGIKRFIHISTGKSILVFWHSWSESRIFEIPTPNKISQQRKADLC
jgi:dTDP-D-glucose 4,6-dehydratase